MAPKGKKHRPFFWSLARKTGDDFCAPGMGAVLEVKVHP
jgi:hypothetical protein